MKIEIHKLTGVRIACEYNGKDRVGTVEKVRWSKGGELATVQLDDGNYRSFYLDKVKNFQVLSS